MELMTRLLSELSDSMPLAVRSFKNYSVLSPQSHDPILEDDWTVSNIEQCNSKKINAFGVRTKKFWFCSLLW